MDALSRAGRTLAHARTLRAGVVTPDSVTSPMDEAATDQIPRIIVADPPEPGTEATLVMDPVPVDPTDQPRP